jgi:AGCS family alanine or glycine:cation symporter
MELIERGWVFVLLGVCLYFTVRLRGVPFRHLGYALHGAHRGVAGTLRLMMASIALTAAPASVLGVCAAIRMGGIGSVFWLLFFAMLGLVVKFAEVLLCLKYRVVNERAEMCSGMMHTIAHGLKKRWLAVCFAFFGVCAACVAGGGLQGQGIISMAPSRAVSACVLVFSLLIAVILHRGDKRWLMKLIAFAVPFFGLVYGAGVLIILLSRLDSLLGAFCTLCTSAFSAQALAGGLLGAAVQCGMNWAFLSHQTGWGSSILAAAKTDVPGRQALIAMGASFLTICLSFLTALVIVVTGTYRLGLSPEPFHLITRAFQVIPAGEIIVKGILFVWIGIAMATWAYFGEKCMEFLSEGKALLAYRFLFCAWVGIGLFVRLDQLWPWASCFTSLMSLINVCALVAMSSVVTAEMYSLRQLISQEKWRRKSAIEDAP